MKAFGNSKAILESNFKYEGRRGTNKKVVGTNFVPYITE